MLDNFYFQIWFSKEHGFTFDIYPLLQFQIDFGVIAVVLGLVIALRIRKAIQNRKRKFINKTVASDF